MVNRFTLKTLFTPEELTNLVQNFGFKRMSEKAIETTLYNAFSDYILSALTELGDNTEDNKKIYLEANHHIDKARKLLEGMPHPAGKMAYRLNSMMTTLNKLIEGKDNFAAERANRFMEKNLVRRLKELWKANTSTPFHSGGDGSGKNPRDFILTCFAAAGRQYPEIVWFKEVDYTIADMLIRVLSDSETSTDPRVAAQPFSLIQSLATNAELNHTKFQ